jgi:hypothetical protein
MFFRKMIFLILLISLSVYILGEENYEGYIAIRVNKLLKYDFAKVYTNEDINKIYVNLPEMLELIELDTVRYDEEKGVVEGYIPHQLISGSDSDKKILWKTNKNAIIREGELYVEYREIQNIFPVENINWSSSELFLDIDYEFMLPAELKLLRDNQRKRNFYKYGDADDDDDVIKVEREVITPGILSFNFNWDDFSKEDKTLSYQYHSIFLYGELSLAGELYEDQSLDFYRLDYDNILKDKTISLGKTTLFNTPRIFQGSSGITGVSINRKSVNFTTSSNKGKETIEGFAPVNSTVELYQSNFLIAFQTVDNSGFFKFSEIRSKSFSDSYIIKIYDERGFLLEERKYSSMFKSEFLKKGETDYQLAIGEADNDDKNLVSGVDFYWGIFDRVTYNPGFYYSENKTLETGTKILKNSLLYRSKMIHYPYYTKLDVYTDIENPNNGYDWEYKQKLFFDLQLDLYYSKNDTETEKPRLYSDIYKAVLAKNVRNWYLSLEYEREDFFKEDSEENYLGEVTYNINSSTRFTFKEEYNKIEEEHLTTASLDYIFDNGIDLQLEAGKGWGDNSDSEFARLAINKSPNRSKTPYSFNSGVQFSGNDGDTDWSAFISVDYYFGRGGTFSGNYDTNNNERFGMNYNASINLARPFENHPPESSASSWVEGNIFLDENLNGKLDGGEIPIEGVGIFSGRNQAISDEKGYYYLGGISPDNVNEIKYSYENLNPDLISLNDKNKLMIPSTAGYFYSIPLTTASGVTGFVEFDSDLEIKERSKKMIFARMNIQIIEGNKIIREIPVEPGGFYILDGLKPGKYRVRANYLGVKEITFEKDEILLEINPGKYGNFYEGINLKVKTYE